MCVMTFSTMTHNVLRGEQQVKLCRGKYTFFKDEYRAKVKKNFYYSSVFVFIYIFLKQINHYSSC